MFIKFLRGFNLKMYTASFHERDTAFTIFQIYSPQKTLTHFLFGMSIP